ncbi:RIIa domain-containing protein 1 isoform X3 [Aquila chrysaetos chrysaetos]|uniref:RIIa domain-containing protein 1 isoform X3 n=1 Tax=Aquila chrysaetos chrysaetos TaxID=223781 RepID=UPI0011772366|nr:RIIa domain-containing protein 1 isoform X3 [Aquila chrysaetos chrysaetos]
MEVGGGNPRAPPRPALSPVLIARSRRTQPRPPPRRCHGDGPLRAQPTWRRRNHRRVPTRELLLRRPDDVLEFAAGIRHSERSGRRPSAMTPI